jgi:hypothetical protein
MGAPSAFPQNYGQQALLRSLQQDLIFPSQQQIHGTIQHQIQQGETSSRSSGFPLLPNEERQHAPILYNREDTYPSSLIHSNTGVPPSLPHPPYQHRASQYQNIAAGTGYSFPFLPIGGPDAQFQMNESIALHDLNRQGMNYQQRLRDDVLQQEASFRRFSSNVAATGTGSSPVYQQIQQQQPQPSQSFQLLGNRLEDSDHFLSAINEVLGPPGNENDDSHASREELDDPV